MPTKKAQSKTTIRSVADVEKKLAAQIRGEKLHGKKLARVPKLSRLKYFTAAQKKLVKLRKEEATLEKKIAAVRVKLNIEATKVQTAIKHDHEIQDGYLTKAQMKDFKVRK